MRSLSSLQTVLLSEQLRVGKESLHPKVSRTRSAKEACISVSQFKGGALSVALPRDDAGWDLGSPADWSAHANGW